MPTIDIPIGSGFGVENLPYGAFSTAAAAAARVSACAWVTT